MKESVASCSIDWQKRRADIADGALALYLERPWPIVSIENIAEHLGISYWQVYYSFDGQEDIYRAAIGRLIDTVATGVAATPETRKSVNRTIQSYVRYAAGIVDSDAYQELLFLCLRDQHTDSWVRSAYENKIAEPLRKGLEDAVASAGDRNGLNLVLLHGVRDRFLTMLETTLALPKLFHRREIAIQNFEQAIAATTKHILSSTCTFDGFGNDEPTTDGPLAAWHASLSQNDTTTVPMGRTIAVGIKASDFRAGDKHWSGPR